MLIKNKVVHNCPVTRGSQGRLTLTPEVVAAVAGAVGDRDEWAVFLLGRRSEDGLDVEVDGWEVVPGQVRSHATVDWDSQGESQPDGCVGVMHSHHTMGAFFSEKDRTELNPRFPVSIVVATAMESDEARWLGWSYLAEGRVTLPCGALGRVGFKVNVPGVDQWPDPGCGFVEFVTDHSEDLGDCTKVQARLLDKLYERRTSQCGLWHSKDEAIVGVAGRTTALLEALPPAQGPTWTESVSKGTLAQAVLWARPQVDDSVREAELWARYEELNDIPLHLMTDEEFDEYERLEAELWDGPATGDVAGWQGDEGWQDEWMQRHAEEVLALEGEL